MSDEELPTIPPHERPVMNMMADAHQIEYVAYKTIDEARRDAQAIVVFEGDYGGQIYLTCPLTKVACSLASLERLLNEMGLFAWTDGESLYFERVSEDRSVCGGMGGGLVEDDVWIHYEFRNLCEVGIDILPEVKEVIHGKVESVLPGVVAKLTAYLEALDISAALPDQSNYGRVRDIAHRLERVGHPARAAIPVLRALAEVVPFRDSDLAESVRKIEDFEHESRAE